MKHVLLDDGQTYFVAKTKKDSDFVYLVIGENNCEMKVLLTKDECTELAHNLLNAVGGSYVQ